MPFMLVHNIMALKKHDQMCAESCIGRDASALIDDY